MIKFYGLIWGNIRHRAQDFYEVRDKPLDGEPTEK